MYFHRQPRVPSRRGARVGHATAQIHGRKLPKENDTNPVKTINRTRIQNSPKDHLDSSLDGNHDPLLILKQEPWYN